MIKVSSEAHRVLVAKIHEAGQDQVFACWEALGPQEQADLLEQLGGLNLSLLRKLVGQYLHGGQEGLEARVLQPASYLPVPSTEEERALQYLVREAGEEALRAGQVGLMTATGEIVGGGDFDRPRGTVSVGPVSGKSLFCLHAEKVRALSRRYRSSLPWVIVTSVSNHGAILEHFRQADYFGLNRSEVLFLMQDELPLVNRRGKLLLSDPGKLARGPNGHGGTLLKLISSEEAFRSLEVRGVHHVFYFQVDNPLTRIADPVFLGHHLRGNHDVSSKMVQKADPQEKVGVFCQFNGTVGVVEHRELSQADQERRLAGGQLEFCAGNMAVHVFSMDFLRRLRDERVQLPYHCVERTTPFVDHRGAKVIPRCSNSIQFECFIFDALPFARSPLIVEALRQEEFSPVKTLRGERHSLASARRDLSRMYARWLESAGAHVERNGGEPPPIEISPLFALDAEELKAKLERVPAVAGVLYLS